MKCCITFPRRDAVWKNSLKMQKNLSNMYIPTSLMCVCVRVLRPPQRFCVCSFPHFPVPSFLCNNNIKKYSLSVWMHTKSHMLVSNLSGYIYPLVSSFYPISELYQPPSSSLKTLPSSSLSLSSKTISLIYILRKTTHLSFSRAYQKFDLHPVVSSNHFFDNTHYHTLLSRISKLHTSSLKCRIHRVRVFLFRKYPIQTATANLPPLRDNFPVTL
mmetsp:Transcript_30575/g.44427  ORF Transcript_30575/g.44427 Transcript_30575/m.44427 type:complete len:215 (+) Transcript_30575:470-1114(+)